MNTVVSFRSAFVLGLALLVVPPSVATSPHSPGPQSSLTLIPVLLGGKPSVLVTEVLALGFEKAGLENITISGEAFASPAGAPMDALATAFTDFAREHPVTTDYVLFAEFNGERATGLAELRALLADKKGNVIWSDQQRPSDAAFIKFNAREPMLMAMLLVERASPELGLDQATARAAKPGKYARLLDERSGLPPAEERAAIPARLAQLQKTHTAAFLVVVPVAAAGRSETEIAARLANTIGETRLFKDTAASLDRPIVKAPEPVPNELRTLWDFARALRQSLRENPIAADYVLGVDYRFDADHWQRGYAHFVLCDRAGDWVLVDFQNSHHRDFQAIKPASAAGCEELILQRLRSRIKDTDAPPGAERHGDD